MINRSVIVVKLKQPFLDWAQSIDFEEGLTLERMREDPSAYLVPEVEYDTDQLPILEQCHEMVFEVELEAWYIDRDLWPKNRDVQMFGDWFDVEFHSMASDLCGSLLSLSSRSWKETELAQRTATNDRFSKHSAHLFSPGRADGA